MEPIKIDITLTPSDDMKALIEKLAQSFAGIVAKPGAQPTPRPAAEEPAPAQPVIITRPVTAPAPAVRDVTQDELFRVVATVKDKAGKEAVKKVFTDFGINYSRDCAPERRGELVDKLNALLHA